MKRKSHDSMILAFRILAAVLWLYAASAGCSAAGGMDGTGGGGGMPCTTPQDCPATANECVTLTCLDGMCGTANVASGTACNDGDACTQSDTCQGGTCTGSPVACTAPDQCHVTGTCDPVTGMCSNPELPDGTVCAFASACAAGSCTSNAIAYIKASNTDLDPPLGDNFGWSAALSADGNTLAVGARYEASNATGINGNQADNSAEGAGAVYVFTRSGGMWSQEAYIKPSNMGWAFGWSVALSADGNTLAVGAYLESSNATGIDGNQADESAKSAGAVYVFTRSGGTWSQQAYVKASNTGADDDFGLSVALSGDGNTLAVGASGEDSNATGINGNQADNSASAAGAVYVFTRSGGTWSQQAYVKASNNGLGDVFGRSVALSGDGNTLGVGARFEASNATGINGNQADNSASEAGAVYVFKRSGSTWSQQAYIKASNTGAEDDFGLSIALSGDGNTLAVGASREDSNATGINGNQADGSANGAGAVYVFTRNGGTWSQQAYVKASNTGQGDSFGYSVALSGDGKTLAVGAVGEDSKATGINGDQAADFAQGAGAVYVFTRSGGTWSQQEYVKASNTDVPDFFGGSDAFGLSVALSADGNTLAVGAVGEDSKATGINGDQADNSANDAGAVYVY